MMDRAEQKIDGGQIFVQAFGNSMGYEDGYTDSGPTYRGVDRRWHPSWPGWTHVDLWLRGKMSKQELFKKTDPLVRKFYKTTFWDQMQGDKIAEIDAGLATTMFDFAIHSDPFDAVRALQRSLNRMNRGGITYENLIIDGRMGAKTLAALGKALATPVGGSLNNARLLLLSHYFGSRYMHLIAAADYQSWPGWFLRLAKEVDRVSG